MLAITVFFCVILYFLVGSILAFVTGRKIEDYINREFYIPICMLTWPLAVPLFFCVQLGNAISNRIDRQQEKKDAVEEEKRESMARAERSRRYERMQAEAEADRLMAEIRNHD